MPSLRSTIIGAVLSIVHFLQFVPVLANDASGKTEKSASPASSMAEFCTNLPRPAYAELDRLAGGVEWFELYQIAPGVIAIYEPHQWQEVISWLIEGEQRAVLFDTGNGIGDIAAVVESLTDKPVTVLNSHSHFDHVGGNHRFDTVLGMTSTFTDLRAQGRSNAQIRIEVSADALCRPLPAGITETSHVGRPWTISGRISDGSIIDLGGRQLEVMHVPGHTPDAIALLDREAGFMWTGDSYYSGPIWLYAPETDLDAYANSLQRMIDELPNLRALLPAHNTPMVDPTVLPRVLDAFTQLRAGELPGDAPQDGTVTYRIAGESEFSFLLAEGALD